MSGVIVLAAGALPLGLARSWLPELTWSFPRYLEASGAYLGDPGAGSAWPLLRTPMEAIVHLAYSVWAIHWLPLATIVLLIGGWGALLWQIPAARYKLAPTSLWLLAMIVLLQVPLVLWTAMFGAYAVDWLHLVPTLVLLGVAALLPALTLLDRGRMAVSMSTCCGPSCSAAWVATTCGSRPGASSPASTSSAWACRSSCATNPRPAPTRTGICLTTAGCSARPSWLEIGWVVPPARFVRWTIPATGSSSRSSRSPRVIWA